MLITKQDIIKKLETIPPMPSSVQKTLEYLRQGELKKAADEADKDIVLKRKMARIVNSAYFGFRKEIKNTRLMFSALGIEMAKSVVLSYMVSLLEPKEWKIFKKFNFEEFQRIFLIETERAIIVESDEETYKKYSDALALIPATICLIDELLGSKKRQVRLILEHTELNLGDILTRFTGYSIFTLAAFVAKKWELDQDNVELIKEVECAKCHKNSRVKIAAAIHLTFFKLVSKPQFFILNSFINFNPQTIEIAKKNYERLING